MPNPHLLELIQLHEQELRATVWQQRPRPTSPSSRARRSWRRRAGSVLIAVGLQLAQEPVTPPPSPVGRT
jgi:hypothetical protein